ncbi:PAS domain-containing protein [Actibacterium lipolyticum]|uniref:PAS domain protein n=1 Tax=Actibacterium lipolyticum TaxID=1524263 RepID=A0A238JZ83_9RHOB|nr:PAS domain-containing protein [Actibacterium lipolyticum]SMX35016.1 PAS domain protein [Actibacterium lipolyticum]
MMRMFSGGAKVVPLSNYQDKMRFPILNEVEAYWEGLRSGRSMPARSDVDPRGLERALEFAFVLERVAPNVARFRLAGQHLTALMGMDVRGMPLSALFAPSGRELLGDQIENLFDTPQTIRLTLSGEGGLGKPALDAGMLLLPLHNEVGEVNRALGCLISEGQIGNAPRRFVIDNVQSKPIEVHRVSAPVQAAAGFAETAASFDAKGSNEKGPDAKRPALRLVSSND